MKIKACYLLKALISVSALSFRQFGGGLFLLSEPTVWAIKLNFQAFEFFLQTLAFCPNSTCSQISVLKNSLFILYAFENVIYDDTECIFLFENHIIMQFTVVKETI